MLYIILILILFCGALSILADRIPNTWHSVIIGMLTILLVLVSGFRPGSEVSDFDTYEMTFSQYDFDNRLSNSIEVSFIWLSGLVHYLGGTIRWMIWIYAILAIPLKMAGYRKLVCPEVFYLSVAIYLGNFFMLHDCEQFRIGLGLALTTWAIYTRIIGKWWLSIILCLIATFFHTTAIVMLIPILLTPNELTLWWRLALIGFVGCGIIIWVAGIDIIQELPVNYVEDRMQRYEQSYKEGMHPDIPVIQPLLLMRLGFFGYVIAMYDLIRPHIKALPILLSCQAFSLFCWFSLTGMPVFAVRFSELFGAIEILLFATTIYTIKPRWAGKIAILGVALFFFALNFKYNQFGFR